MFDLGAESLGAGLLVATKQQRGALSAGLCKTIEQIKVARQGEGDGVGMSALDAEYLARKIGEKMLNVDKK